MSIVKAESKEFETVKRITSETIKYVYPHYYPCGAVEFFLKHHNDKNILGDIENGNVYICKDKGKAVGTVTINENEIGRLFVLPEYQGNGYGKELLEFAEKKISENYDEIVIHASFPAKPIYLKRGYVFSEYHSIKTENGDYLCYDMMIKKK